LWLLIDGSTDKGPDIVSAIKDSRIRLIHQENQGVSAARNKGIAEAKYDLIAFLDADDEWHPQFIEEILNLKSKYPMCDVYATNYFYKESDKVLFKTIINGLPANQSDGVIKDYFIVCANSDPLLWTSAVCVNKQAITKIGGFPIGIKSGEDLLTWAKLACVYKIAYTTKSLSYFWSEITSDKKPRVPEIPDIVGYDLETLALSISNNDRSSIFKYISLWHRMRANSFIRLAMRKEAIHEIKEILKHNKLSVTVWTYMIFLFVPTKVLNVLYRHTKSKRRKLISNNQY